MINSLEELLCSLGNLLGTTKVPRGVWRQGCLSSAGNSTMHLSRPHCPHVPRGADDISSCLPRSAPLRAAGGGEVGRKQHERKHLEKRPSEPTPRGVSKQKEKGGQTNGASPAPKHTQRREGGKGTRDSHTHCRTTVRAKRIVAGVWSTAPAVLRTADSPPPHHFRQTPPPRRLPGHRLRRPPTSSPEGQSGQREADRPVETGES